MSKSKTGRPSSYKAEYAVKAGKLCELGATDQELADFFDVSVRTMHRWKLEYPDFCHSLKAGKDLADDRIERSLLEKASGYRYIEQQAIKVRQPGGGEVIEIVEVERAVPPDTTAMIFWLKNRRSDRWRDVHKVEHGRAGEFDQMDDNELDAFITGRQDTAGSGNSRETAQGNKAGVRTKPSGLH